MDNFEKSPCCLAAGIQEVSLHDQDFSAGPIAGNTHSAATLDAEMTAVLRSFLRALAKADVAKQARQQMHEKTMEHTSGHFAAASDYFNTGGATGKRMPKL